MLKQRIITALILAPLMLGGVFLLPAPQFGVFIGAIATIAAWEWANMAGISQPAGRFIYAAIVALALLATASLINHEPAYRALFLAVAGGW